MKFIIIDWCSNVCFQGKTFDSFEDAWGFIYEKVDDEDAFQDYEVIDENEVDQS